MGILNMIKSDIGKKIIIFFAAFAIIYGILLTSLVTEKYSFKEGDIAKIDVKANRDVVDKAATEAKKNQAAENVGDQYDLEVDVETKAEEDINDSFAKINNTRNTNVLTSVKLATLKNNLNYNLTDEKFNTLLTMNKTDLDAFQAFIIKTTEGFFGKNIREGNSDDKKNAQSYIKDQFNNSKFNNEINEIGNDITNSYIKPNLILDEEKTKELKSEAQKKVDSVTIKKDQIVIKEGEPVTKGELQILEDLGVLNSNNNSQWYIYINIGILTFIVLFMEAYYLYRHKRELYNDNSKLILIFSLNVFSLILARSISTITPYLIPLGCVPMILTLLLDNKVSLFINILNCIFISGIVGFNAQITLIGVMSAILVSIIQKNMQMRNDLFYSATYIAIISAIMNFSIGLLLSNNVVDVLKNSGFVFIGGCLSAILTIGLLPFLESMFDIVTTVKLLELSNPNQPLLRRLLMEAPGTYHHSIFVANLAEVATEVVGGNPVLSRICAYYHDVGKIKRPYFFKENQIGKENPHDKINSNLSALVIISHVKDGLELAKEYKLPKIIQDVIVQHHGTTLVKYFYITMKNNSEKPEDIDKENFKYKGPIPMSKECGVIMLADGVEAAVRSIPDPTKGKIEEMVNKIINDRLMEGQLDNCDLTLRDLDIIKKSFLKTLNGVFHDRIEYPTDKEEQGILKK